MSPIPPAAPQAPHLISVNPDPPKAGQPVTICYDFREGDPDPALLQVDIYTSSGTTSMSLALTKANPCDVIQLPEDAVGLLITDPYGPSADCARVISS